MMYSNDKKSAIKNSKGEGEAVDTLPESPSVEVIVTTEQRRKSLDPKSKPPNNFMASAYGPLLVTDDESPNN